MYAPRYRQANMTAFTRASEDGRRAIALAGDDVVAAFRHYINHDNRGRPFILAGHSQGSVLALRLLREVIAPSELRGRLVAAYLIGGPITEGALAELSGIGACASATETGCVVAWNARCPGYESGIDFVELVNTGTPRVCTNPLTWRADDAPADASLSRGAVFWDDPEVPPTPRPGLASARCEDGTLRVELAGKPPRDFMSRLLDHALGDGNYHPIEYGVFFVDLRDNARARVTAFLEREPRRR